jgi:hypothetical protein
MSLGNAINLLLHRAGVGVDEQGDHLILLPYVIMSFADSNRVGPACDTNHWALVAFSKP